MEKQTNLSIIRNRIHRSDYGTVYVAVDFVDISDKTNINAYLARLAEEGLIRRVIRGVYYKAEYNEMLGEYVAPTVDDVALNILGLSTQVPATYVYVSDGNYKEYIFHNITIQFKRTTNREVSKLSYKTALVIQALKALGKDRIDNSVITRLQGILTAEEKAIMLFEAKTATAWIYDYIKDICT